MGGKQSIEVPGGGSEGYHVLRVIFFYFSVENVLCPKFEKN